MPKAKVLSKELILAAMAKTKSNRAAARYCHVSYNHYKKYAKLYKDEESGKTLFELHKNPAGKGIPKFMTYKGKTPDLIDILEGRIPHYHFTPEKIKRRIIHEGLIEEKCSRCEFSEKRVLDQKVPLILYFKNADKKDYSLSNLDFLCYNCYFLYVEDVLTGKQITALEDYKDNLGKVHDTDWELDEHMYDHLKDLGLIEEQAPSGSEYISYIT